MNFAAALAAAPLMPSFLQSLRTWNGFQADGRIKMFFENQFGRFFGDFFDFHAAFGADHQDWLGGGTVEHDAQIQFAGDVAAGFDKDLIDRFAFGAGLNRDQRLAQQPCGRLADLVGTSCQTTTPCWSGLSLTVPLPRPPAWIWALTTAIWPPSLS